MTNRKYLALLLVTLIGDLGDQELAVFLALGRRLLAGQRAYGPLALQTDRRDWKKERAEELADALIYQAIGEVAEKLT